MFELPKHKNRKEMPEYRIWKNMRARCSSPCNKNNGKYQSRNIKVCNRWNDFTLFYQDMGPKPSKKHSIDRIDPYGDYEPSNCRWTDQKTQCENRGEFNKVYTYNGESKVLKEWSRVLNIDYSKLHKRISYQGMSFEEAINYKGPGMYELNGVWKSVSEWSKEYGISKGNLSSRLSRGKTLEEALNTPIRKKTR